MTCRTGWGYAVGLANPDREKQVDFPRIQGFRHVDDVPRPVFSLITETTFVGETEPHHHDKAQLMCVISGVLTMRVAGGLWTVPPHCAMWIPGDVSHAGRVAGHIKILNLYIDADLAASLDQDCGILSVPPFLRELILRFDCEALPAAMGRQREARLIAVLLDELATATLEPIHLPMPNDRRLQRLTKAMIEHPDQRFTIDEWGARVGASNRTLSRLFQRDTGMSFVRWRQQLHVGLALQRLGEGQSVTNIAGDLGYDSVSAFISMFKRMLGTTPARYFEELATGIPEGNTRRTLARGEAVGHAAEADATPNVIPLKKRPA